MNCCSQYLQKVNVWLGILDNRILGSFFIEGTLTSGKYLEFLEYECRASASTRALAVLHSSDQDLDILSNDLWYQQHRLITHDYLDRVFTDHWICRQVVFNGQLDLQN